MKVELERPLYDALRRLARRDRASISTMARDLLRDALEKQEDFALVKIASFRERSSDRASALPHDAVWRAPKHVHERATRRAE